MCIWEPCLLHPAACLLSWLILLVAIQVLPLPALSMLAAGMAFAGDSARRRWWGLLRRTRWLLLTLGLILAYSSPGEALLDIPWLPTESGLADAGLHMLRLIVMLGTLACLFAWLPREAILGGLWAIAFPVRRLGWDVASAVVRLSLVFEILQEAPKPGNWRQLLEEDELAASRMASVRIVLPGWRAADSMLLGGVVLAVIAGYSLP